MGPIQGLFGQLAQQACDPMAEYYSALQAQAMYHVPNPTPHQSQPKQDDNLLLLLEDE